MNKFYSIDKETLEKYVGTGSYGTLSDIEDAREEYFNSDRFLKNRRKFRVRPLEIDVPVEKLKLLSESELAIKETMHEINKDMGMPKPLFKKFEKRFLEAVKVFPPPIDVYISQSEASFIFNVPEIRLDLYRRSGLIDSIKHEEVFTYHWDQLQDLFG